MRAERSQKLSEEGRHNWPRRKLNIIGQREYVLALGGGNDHRAKVPRKRFTAVSTLVHTSRAKGHCPSPTESRSLQSPKGRLNQRNYFKRGKSCPNAPFQALRPWGAERE